MMPSYPAIRVSIWNTSCPRSVITSLGDRAHDGMISARSPGAPGAGHSAIRRKRVRPQAQSCIRWHARFSSQRTSAGPARSAAWGRTRSICAARSRPARRPRTRPPPTSARHSTAVPPGVSSAARIASAGSWMHDADRGLVVADLPRRRRSAAPAAPRRAARRHGSAGWPAIAAASWAGSGSVSSAGLRRPPATRNADAVPPGRGQLVQRGRQVRSRPAARAR